METQEDKQVDKEKLFEVGNQFLSDGKLNEALECFETVLVFKPKYYQAYHNKGITLLNLGRYEEAFQCFNTAIKIDPSSNFSYNSKGLALRNLGQIEESIKCFDIALNLNPCYVFALNNKGLALRDLGKNKEAIELFDTAIKLNQRYADAFDSKGLSLRDLGQNEAAIECFNSSIRLKSDADTYLDKGVALWNLGKHKEAISCYDTAINLNESQTDAYLNRAYALSKQNKVQEAIKQFNIVLKLNPNYILCYCNRALQYLLINNEQQALEDFFKADQLLQNRENFIQLSQQNVAYVSKLKQADKIQLIGKVTKVQQISFEIEQAIVRMKNNVDQKTVQQFQNIKVQKNKEISSFIDFLNQNESTLDKSSLVQQIEQLESEFYALKSQLDTKINKDEVQSKEVKVSVQPKSNPQIEQNQALKTYFDVFCTRLTQAIFEANAICSENRQVLEKLSQNSKFFTNSLSCIPKIGKLHNSKTYTVKEIVDGSDIKVKARNLIIIFGESLQERESNIKQTADKVAFINKAKIMGDNQNQEVNF